MKKSKRDALFALLAEATPAPWFFSGNDEGTGGTFVIDTSGGGALAFASFDGTDFSKGTKDLELAAAAVSALRGLLVENEELERERDEAIHELLSIKSKSEEHDDDCAIMRNAGEPGSQGLPCSCGAFATSLTRSRKKKRNDSSTKIRFSRIK
jgi:hypothetical protein